MRKSVKNTPLVEAVEEHPVPLRMSRIVDRLIKDDEIFREIDRAKMMETLSDLMENPPSDLMSITDDEQTLLEITR